VGTDPSPVALPLVKAPERDTLSPGERAKPICDPLSVFCFLPSAYSSSSSAEGLCAATVLPAMCCGTIS
jgi:hypothetical protein